VCNREIFNGYLQAPKMMSKIQTATGAEWGNEMKGKRRRETESAVGQEFRTDGPNVAISLFSLV
jgi:hypothetical protein